MLKFPKCIMRSALPDFFTLQLLGLSLQKFLQLN
jgi:hypothetical protein